MRGLRLWLGVGVVAAAVTPLGASGVSGNETIATIAGGGIRGFAGDGGPATSARLYYPKGVAVDGKGNVYIADRDNLRIRKVSPGGRITTFAGNGRYGSSGDGGPATSARLYYPAGVAVDGKGNVYITNTFNQRVRKVGKALARAASGACSKTTALQAMTRYHLVSDPQLPQPIGQLLCGAFAGPGSRAMAASSAHGVCLPYAGWGVFRYLNGDWRLVPGGYHNVILSLGIAKSGNDIIEKATIRHPGETICTASGVRARVWHWNGSRLIAKAWKQVAPARPGPTTVHLYQFESPSHNISCRVGDENLVYCRTWEPPQSVHMGIDGKLDICTGSRRCTGPCGPRNPPLACSRVTVPVLAYGQQSESAGYRCKSEMTGITCTVIRSAKGFLINRSGISRVVP